MWRSSFRKMVRVRELSITLAGAKEVFYAGDEIKGYVTVHYDRETALRAIRLRIVGEVNCVWTELGKSSHDSDPATLIAFSSSDYILDATIILNRFNNDDPMDTFIHQAGKQLYDFSYRLNQGLPSSIEGAHGSVRYYLKATIEEANGDLFHSKSAFTVLTYIDLNDKSFIKRPGGEISNSGGTICCPTGWIYCRAYLDRAAYCPGESIFVTVHVENSSKQPVPSVVIQLEKQETYKACRFDSDNSSQWQEKVSSTYIVSVRCLGVPSNEELNIDDQAIDIPVTEPTLKTGLISVDYFVHILLQVHKDRNLRLLIPVVIGTVPFRGLSKKVGSKLSLKSEGTPPVYLPVVGARGFQIKGDEDGEYLSLTDNYLPVYPCAL